jgi:hypothetical protein
MGEQTPARQLITDLVAAEAAGFDFSVLSDHYFPWLEEQGHQPNAWAVLGAAAQATGRLPLSTSPGPAGRPRGRHFQVERAKLYDLPGQAPPIGIAVSGQLTICYDRDETAARRREHGEYEGKLRVSAPHRLANARSLLRSAADTVPRPGAL